jgi:hypothetical protein
MLNRELDGAVAVAAQKAPTNRRSVDQSKRKPQVIPGVFMWARQDLNLQPTDYESAALTGLSYGPGMPQVTWDGAEFPWQPRDRATGTLG